MSATLIELGHGIQAVRLRDVYSVTAVDKDGGGTRLLVSACVCPPSAPSPSEVNTEEEGASRFESFSYQALVVVDLKPATLSLEKFAVFKIPDTSPEKAPVMHLLTDTDKGTKYVAFDVAECPLDGEGFDHKQEPRKHHERGVQGDETVVASLADIESAMRQLKGDLAFSVFECPGKFGGRRVLASVSKKAEMSIRTVVISDMGICHGQIQPMRKTRESGPNAKEVISAFHGEELKFAPRSLLTSCVIPGRHVLTAAVTVTTENPLFGDRGVFLSDGALGRGFVVRVPGSLHPVCLSICPVSPRGVFVLVCYAAVADKEKARSGKKAQLQTHIFMGSCDSKEMQAVPPGPFYTEDPENNPPWLSWSMEGTRIAVVTRKTTRVVELKGLFDAKKGPVTGDLVAEFETVRDVECEAMGHTAEKAIFFAIKAKDQSDPANRRCDSYLITRRY